MMRRRLCLVAAAAAVVLAAAVLSGCGSAAELFGQIRKLVFPPGTLDASFGNGGTAVTKVSSDFDLAHALGIDPDGRILVVGTTFGSQPRIALVRYTTAGLLDASFGSAGIVSPAVGTDADTGNGLAIQGDGKVVVTGSANSGVSDEIALIRLTSSGVLDATFGGDGIVTTDVGGLGDVGNAVAIQADGGILVTGSSFAGSADRVVLLRYLGNGTLDSSFGAGGVVTTSIGSNGDAGLALALQDDGKIVVAGTSNDGARNRFAVLRYTTAGVLDGSFGTGGITLTSAGPTTEDRAWSVAVQSDGKVLVAGSTHNGTRYSFLVVRYTPSGVPDSTFDADGIIITSIGSISSPANGMTTQGDGRIVACGSAGNGTDYDLAIARYTAAGALDAEWGQGGFVTTPVGQSDEACTAAVIQRDGKIVVAGNAKIGTDRDFLVARYWP